MTPRVSVATDEQRTLSQQIALARCSEALLLGDDVAEIGPALMGLLDALDGLSLFVDTNETDPDLGPCTNAVYAAIRPGVVVDPEYWAFMPWSRLPDTYDKLIKGEVQAISDTAHLSPIERETLETVDIAAQLVVPIAVEGIWTGLIGVSDDSGPRTWRSDEIELLRTVGNMIAAFWEKQATIERLRAAVETSEEQLRYQFALSQCSNALTGDNRQFALQRALDALMRATQATCGMVALHEQHPTLGPSYREACRFSVYETEEHGSVPARNRDLIPWSSTPDGYQLLADGRQFTPGLDIVGPIENAFSGDDPLPILSELDLPIFVDGTFAGLVGFGDHQTQRVWSESEVTLLRTAAGMIGSFLSQRNAWENLEELVRSKDEFVAGVSHELRTPLSIVVGLACELRDRADDFSRDEQIEFHRLIATESIEVANLVEDLLIAARSDIGGVVVEAIVFDLAGEVSSATIGFTRERQIPIQVSEPSKALGDPTRTRQIIRNLLSNAIRHGGKDIRITVETSGSFVSLLVSDDGEPIESPDRIFEMYERGPGSKTQPGSMGIGLTISRRLARLMGGDLRYRHDNQRTSFELLLPKAGT